MSTIANVPVREMHFFRHGQTVMNSTPERIAGRSRTTELTEKGRAEARALGPYIIEQKFDRFFTSETVRTQQTFAESMKGAGMSQWTPYTVDQRMTERSQGSWEGLVRKEVYTKERKAQVNWDFVPGDPGTGGESHAMVAKRMVEMLDATKTTGEDVPAFVKEAFYCHGYAIKIITTVLLGMDHEAAFKMHLDNASVTVIREYSDGSYELVAQNSTEHLPADLKPGPDAWG
ncbi:MAG: 2,3-bisphosphoglycerate-dependent phosphoglycerate mutase [Chlamydiia bacterium]|nr:2,3-bisphosphoglycerate-dependent phosphoglycerate mutase [Chlamydiia bacterium]MCH9615288.1 2,3-bisphosphoglycerate-dependent phosphoglycerate mutase [Chlamydiia bacterium]MCH9628390.1 2,3-bisphosphoglycerate-dependent phosphoglycerate mutase [Chlamydiia bacterium]